MAKIELIARPVDIYPKWYIRYLENQETAEQHLFIMQTNDNGEQFTISGGPENFKDNGAIDKTISSLLDDIKVRKRRYNEDDKNGEGKFKEYFKSRIIIEGSDEEIKLYIDKIWHKAAGINRGGFDYKWPTAGDEQNSNTVARIILEAAGLEFKIPSYKSGKPVLAPSYDAEINHTKLDSSGIGNKIKEFLFAKDMKRNLGVKINKAYAKYPDKIDEIKECIEEEVSKNKRSGEASAGTLSNKKSKANKDKIKEDTFDKVDKMFGYFNNIKAEEKVNSLDRFRALEEDAKEKGDGEFAAIFGNLAKQQQQVQKLFAFMDKPEFNDKKSIGDKMRYLDQNKEEIMDTPNEERDFSLITSEFKGEIMELDLAFEKCAPDSFYSEDL